MSVLQIAGKNPSNIAKGILVEPDGKLITTKEWQTSMITLLDKSDIVDGSVFDNLSNNVDLSNYGIVGLRIQYKMPGVSTTINLFSDINTQSTVWMYGLDGTSLAFTLPAASSAKVVMITPDDFKYLPYLRYFKVRVDPSGTPTSAGNITIYAVVKR